ncbi:MAG: hypothetical protein JWO76_2617 [Nocardioides sp.]|nr:hypothetical protein [Nocardioides sp.]
MAGVSYFATAEDQAALLDHLGEPDQVTLHPWPVVHTPLQRWTRAQALAARQVMVVRRDLGPPVVVRPGDAAMTESSRSGLFNRLNWERLAPSVDEGLVDSNASPVMLWTPGAHVGSVLHESFLGSQADAMAAVGADFERWVTRSMGWIRRRGTKVWGLEQASTRPDLDIEIGHVSAVYALPNALSALENGAAGRW